MIRSMFSVKIRIVGRTTGVNFTWKTVDRSAVVSIVNRFQRRWISFKNDQLENQVENRHRRRQILSLHVERVDDHLEKIENERRIIGQISTFQTRRIIDDDQHRFRKPVDQLTGDRHRIE